MKPESKEPQKENGQHKTLAINLEGPLRNLVRGIRNGEKDKLVTFEQISRYASPEVRAKILGLL